MIVYPPKNNKEEKEKLRYYTVELVLTEKDYRSFNSSVYDIVYHTKPKNKYFFKSKDNAMKHINGFLQSRPSNEEWVEVKPNGNAIKHFCYEYGDKCKYDACVIKHDVVFNDCEVQDDATEKIPMYVDMAKYGNVFGTGSDGNLGNGHAHEYVRMDLTPQEIKSFIDKGIDMKSFKEQ